MINTQPQPQQMFYGAWQQQQQQSFAQSAYMQPGYQAAYGQQPQSAYNVEPGHQATTSGVQQLVAYHMPPRMRLTPCCHPKGCHLQVEVCDENTCGYTPSTHRGRIDDEKCGKHFCDVHATIEPFVFSERLGGRTWRLWTIPRRSCEDCTRERKKRQKEKEEEDARGGRNAMIVMAILMVAAVIVFFAVHVDTRRC